MLVHASLSQGRNYEVIRAASGGLAASADGLPKSGAIEVFAQIHQSEKSIQNAGFHFVRQVQAACGSARQHFSVVGDEANDFHLACMGSFSVHSFTPHLGAIVFDFQREMKHAQMDRFKRRRHLSLATVFTARRMCRHGWEHTPSL
jgi:hypothetical protein